MEKVDFNSTAIHVPTLKISQSVQEELFKLGWVWASDSDSRNQTIRSYPDSPDGLIYFDYNKKILWQAERGGINKKIITVTEFFDNLEKYRVKPKYEVKISDQYKATDFDKEGFKVGCQRVTWGMIDEIIKIRKEMGV